MREINRIIVHCTATPPDMDVDIDDVRRWHKERGWSDVGYHALITRDGTCQPGRPLEAVGSHAKGHNQDSIGIALAGGVRRSKQAGVDVLIPDANFTIEQYDRLVEYIDDFQFERWKDDKEPVEVLGHRDLPGVTKACPSFDVRALVKNNLNWYS